MRLSANSTVATDCEHVYSRDRDNIYNLQQTKNTLHAITVSVKRIKGKMNKDEARCYFNVRSKADISQLNLPHGA